LETRALCETSDSVKRKVLIFLNCANPNCQAEILYLYEGEWIVIELPSEIQRYWLCGACSPSLCVIYKPSKGVRVVLKDMGKKSPEPKPTGAADSPSKAA
jgi:hypothetical protein